jgi:hypothetical protein
MPAGFMLRSRINFDFVTPDQVLELSREGLAKSGPVVARVIARAVQPAPGELAGVTIALDGNSPQDRTPPCKMQEDPLCPGSAVFNYYSIEVVQRIGYDSFTPDNGVLIAKNKNKETRSCGYNCFTWVIDAHPEDINMVDFNRPDGTPVMRTVADYRQLNDALFHAGLNSGSQFEWEDTPNRLHFYVIDIQKNADGILSYQLGVRSLDGSGPQQRGMNLTAPESKDFTNKTSAFNFVLKNTGTAAKTDASLHKDVVADQLNNDIYRLTLTGQGQGWSAALTNELAAAAFGESVKVPVYTSPEKGSSPTATITLEARSESDPSKFSTASFTISRKK